MNENLLKILIPALVGMIAVFWIYFKMLNIAHQKNLVDNPDARKLQKLPVPVVGGLCVSFGVICAVLAGSCMMNCTHLVPILMAMSVMVYVGAMDDILGLSPNMRFLIEVLVILALIYGGGGCIDSLHGTWGVDKFSWWIGVPLTVFACVGIINAMNMIDGVNGLSSGLCITCSVLFSYAFYRGKDIPNAMLCMSMAAGLFPFLLHNVLGKTSKMFIGDAGTMMMGVLMSWCVIQVLRADSTANWVGYQEQGMNVVALTLAILSVPVFDTIRVMLLRIYHHKSPFEPDKTHLHHQLYAYSKSHSLTSLIEIFLDLLICSCFAITYLMRLSYDVQLYVVIIVSVLLVWGLYFFLNHNYRLDTNFAYRMRRSMAASRQGDKNWWKAVQTWVDSSRIGFFVTTSKSKMERRKEQEAKRNMKKESSSK